MYLKKDFRKYQGCIKSDCKYIIARIIYISSILTMFAYMLTVLLLSVILKTWTYVFLSYQNIPQYRLLAIFYCMVTAWIAVHRS